MSKYVWNEIAVRPEDLDLTRGFSQPLGFHTRDDSYSRYCSQAHEDFFKEVFGLTNDEFEQEYGLTTLIVYSEGYPLQRTFLGDILHVRTSLTKIGTTSIAYFQVLFRGDEEVYQGKKVAVFVDAKTSQKASIPQALRKKLEDYLEES